MDKVKVIGIRTVNFTARDGREINGFTIFYGFPSRDTEGYRTDDLFIGASRWAQLSYEPHVGDDVTILYNRYGKVADVLFAG